MELAVKSRLKKSPYMTRNPRALKQKHIILADDDQDHAFLFERILKQVSETHQLTVVHDGPALMQLLQTLTPDLIFLDLKMPGKGGMECLKQIRTSPSLSHLPVIVYSSSSKMNDIQRSYKQQADLYMVKPFYAEHLKNALEAILSLDLKNNSTLRNHYFINNRFVPFTATGV